MSPVAWRNGLIASTVVCAAVALVLLLAGCATVAPASPQQAVYALESEYAAALAVGAAYNELPRCPSARDGLCSDPVKVTQLRESVKAATLALNVVEATARANGDVVSALLVASTVVDSLRLLTLDMKVK